MHRPRNPHPSSWNNHHLFPFIWQTISNAAKWRVAPPSAPSPDKTKRVHHFHVTLINSAYERDSPNCKWRCWSTDFCRTRWFLSRICTENVDELTSFLKIVQCSRDRLLFFWYWLPINAVIEMITQWGGRYNHFVQFELWTYKAYI